MDDFIKTLDAFEQDDQTDVNQEIDDLMKGYANPASRENDLIVDALSEFGDLKNVQANLNQEEEKADDAEVMLKLNDVFESLKHEFENEIGQDELVALETLWSKISSNEPDETLNEAFRNICDELKVDPTDLEEMTDALGNLWMNGLNEDG